MQPQETPHVEPTLPAKSLCALPSSVLVVDADNNARALYRQFFELVGCDVVEASDGREALTKALVQPPALVLTEVVLPFVDGYALCEILRLDRTTAHVLILVVTAESRPAQIERARRAGADAVLIKPTTQERVLAETRRLVMATKDLAAQAAEAGAAAKAPLDSSAHRRTRLSMTCARYRTTTPPETPPALACPSCYGALTYEHSHVGGVSDRHREQWDQYVCHASCGTFHYRHRTRKLRRVE
jgi:CheY-like chemotaxis protein